MSDVIAPPVCGVRNVRQSGGGRRGGGEVEAGGAVGRRGGGGSTVAKAAMALGIGPETCDARECERLGVPEVGQHLHAAPARSMYEVGAHPARLDSPFCILPLAQQHSPAQHSAEASTWCGRLGGGLGEGLGGGLGGGAGSGSGLVLG